MWILDLPLWHSIPLLMLASLARSYAESVSPSNDTQVDAAIGLSNSNNSSNAPVLQLTALTRNARTPPFSGLSGTSFIATPANQLNITTSSIALISCDPEISDYAGNIKAIDVFATAEQRNATAIVFYSSTSDWCTLSPPNNVAYPYVYSLRSRNDTQTLMAQLNSTTPPGNLSLTLGALQRDQGNGSSNNGTGNYPGANGGPLGPSPSTAVAMIVLYAITGLITALFLIIILTGAVRAHRHPERYGPRNLGGRSRQTRAGGLARAMLDTIPIVKFGERQEPKPTDVELAPAANDPTSERTESQPPLPSDAADTTAGAEKAATKDEHAEAPPRQSNGGIAAASASAVNAGDSTGENQGCSICTEDFEAGQDQRVLPCDHRFHPACIDPWLLNVSGTCPLCRIDLRPQDARGSTEEPSEDGEGGSENDLPPPINLEEGRRSRVRRSVLMAITGVVRPDHMTREERILALRRYRMAQHARRRQSGPPAAAQDTTSSDADVPSRDETTSGVGAGAVPDPASTAETLYSGQGSTAPTPVRPPAASSNEEETRRRRRLSRLLNIRTRRTAPSDPAA